MKRVLCTKILNELFDVQFSLKWSNRKPIYGGFRLEVVTANLDPDLKHD